MHRKQMEKKERKKEEIIPVQQMNKGKSCEAQELLLEDSLGQMHSPHSRLLLYHSWIMESQVD